MSQDWQSRESPALGRQRHPREAQISLQRMQHHRDQLFKPKPSKPLQELCSPGKVRALLPAGQHRGICRPGIEQFLSLVGGEMAQRGWGKAQTVSQERS